MEKLNIEIETYDVGNGFRVEIVTDNIEKTYEAWVYHKDYGVKSFCLGVEADGCDKETFLKIIGENVISYEEIYKQDCMN